MINEKEGCEARLVTMEHNGETRMFAISDEVFDDLDMTIIKEINPNAGFVRFNGSPGDGGHFVYGKVVNPNGLYLSEWCTVFGKKLDVKGDEFHVESVVSYAHREIKKPHKALMIFEAGFILSKRHGLDYENFEEIFMSPDFEKYNDEFNRMCDDLRLYRWRSKYELKEMTPAEYEMCVDEFGQE